MHWVDGSNKANVFFFGFFSNIFVDIFFPFVNAQAFLCNMKWLVYFWHTRNTERNQFKKKSFLPELNSPYFSFCLSGEQVYVSFQFLLLPDKNKSNIENWARTKGNIFDQSTPTGHYHLFSDWILLSCRFSWALLFLFLISLIFFRFGHSFRANEITAHFLFLKCSLFLWFFF